MATKKETGLVSLKRDIKDKRLKPLYLFFGEEIFLKELYEKRIISQIPDGGFEDFNRIRIDGSKAGFDEYDEVWESFPMMAEKRLVIIKDSGIFSRPNEETKKFWNEKFDRISDDTVVIFDEAKVDKRSVLYKKLAKNGLAVEFAILKDADLVTWVNGECLKAKKKIKKENAYYLVSMCDPGLVNLKNELDKLFSYCDAEITKSDIDRVVSKGTQIKIFELTDGIMNGDVKRATEILTDLRVSNEQAFGVMYLLYSTIDKMLHAKLLKGEAADYIASQLKTSPYIAKKYISSANGFSEDMLIRMITRIPEIDLEIKQGEINDWTAVEQFITECIYYRK